MIGKSLLTRLLATVLLLPIALALVTGSARLLAAMNDAAGAAWLGRLSQGLALAWVFSVLLLLVGLAVRQLESDDRPPRS